MVKTLLGKSTAVIPILIANMKNVILVVILTCYCLYIDYVDKLMSIVIEMMNDEEFSSELDLPAPPLTMTDAMDVVKDKESAVLQHETRFSFI